MTKREELAHFLRHIAIQSYNYQYGTQFSATDDEFEVDLIVGNHDSDIAYDVSIPKSIGYLRLRVYLYVGERDQINSFTPLLDASYVPNALGDEIMMANGVMDALHIRNDGWNIKAFIEENRISRGIIARDGEYIITEDDGLVIIREED
jgi:hypothetical protein